MVLCLSRNIAIQIFSYSAIGIANNVSSMKPRIEGQLALFTLTLTTANRVYRLPSVLVLAASVWLLHPSIKLCLGSPWLVWLIRRTDHHRCGRNFFCRAPTQNTFTQVVLLHPDTAQRFDGRDGMQPLRAGGVEDTIEQLQAI